MKKGVCSVSVAAIRATPSHQSEMVSQILFGETLDIVDSESAFLKIKMHFDGYEGWVSSNQITEITEEEFLSRNTSVLLQPFVVNSLEKGESLLSIGSELLTENEQKFENINIADTALQFLNVPFLWSGRSFFGVDCSGFVQLVYKANGISLPRDSHQQAEVGEALSFVEECTPGDLAFFENEEGKIVHVGIMLNEHEIIHAFGHVRIDSLDSSGIFNKELNKHTHKLRFLRNVIS